MPQSLSRPSSVSPAYAVHRVAHHQVGRDHRSAVTGVVVSGVRAEGIADAEHRSDDPRLVRIVLQRRADLRDEVLYVLFFHEHASPDLLQQFLLGHDARTLRDEYASSAKAFGESRTSPVAPRTWCASRSRVKAPKRRRPEDPAIFQPVPDDSVTHLRR